MKKKCMVFEEDAYVRLANDYLFKIDGGELHVESPDGSLSVVSGDDEIIGLLKLEGSRVLTASKGGALKFWNNRGRKITECREHASEIIYVCEVKSQSKTHLVSLSKNERFVIQNSQRRVIGTIEIGLSEPEGFGYLSDDRGLYILTPEDGLAFFNWVGKEFFTFKELNEPASSIRSFENGYYLIDSIKGKGSDFGISLWDDSGNLIKRHLGKEFGFSSVDDVFELDDAYLAVITKSDTVIVFDSKGEKYAEHASDEEICKSIRRFLADSQRVREYRESKKNILNFQHFSNPTHATSRVPVFEEENSELLKVLDKKTNEEKMVWDFFNRPFIPRIFRVLQPEQRNTNKSIRVFKKQADANNEVIGELSDKINARSFIFKLWSLMVSVIVVSAVIMTLAAVDYISLPETILSYVDQSTAQLLILSGFFLLFIHLYTIHSRARKRKSQRREKDTLENNNRVLDLMSLSFGRAISDIETYKPSLVEQIPVFNSPGLYDGSKVQQYFERIIKEKIEPVGLLECGISKDDIINRNKEAIILNDWSLIQNKDDYAQGKIKQVKDNDHWYNERSFFPMKDQKMLFAVQYLQFIFLTDDKLDVFTTFYDFVEDEFISKQAHAFFYKDVTNFSRKDISAPIEIRGAEKSINSNAVEVTLSVSSGESIKLTIQNSETLDEIMKDAAQQDHGEEENSDQYIEDLQCEIEELKHDDSMDEGLRKQSVEMLQREIETSQNKSSQDSIEELNQKANQAINNIRSQINKFKTVEA